MIKNQRVGVRDSDGRICCWCSLLVSIITPGFWHRVYGVVERTRICEGYVILQSHSWIRLF